MTARFVILLCVLAAPLAAQQPPARPQRAVPPATKQSGASKAPDTKAADTKGQTKAADTKGQTKAADTKAPARPGLAVAPEAEVRPRVPVIMREVFTYDSEGRRDPFVTLLTSEELRPTVADLRLVGTLLDPRRPIAVMRDLQTNTQYRVTTGMKIGRMKVALIQRGKVIFSIEEFGLNRTDSLELGDTTKVRRQ